MWKKKKKKNPFIMCVENQKVKNTYINTQKI